jgi:hypothetical protein
MSEDDVPNVRSHAAHAAKSHQAGQAFQSVGFVGDLAVINKHWAEKCEPHLGLL